MSFCTRRTSRLVSSSCSGIWLECCPTGALPSCAYDRRAFAGGRDVPYQLQVDDLERALGVLASEVGPVPTGLWGFSQGAWVSLLAAAADRTLSFLILVGCSAVSPARQMRYGTAEQLRRAGFGPDAVAELNELRAGGYDIATCRFGHRLVSCAEAPSSPSSRRTSAFCAARPCGGCL